MRRVKFSYTFGGNIELDVVAVISAGRAETATSPREYPEAELIYVKLAGTETEVETDDIIIKTNRKDCFDLDDLLIEAALEQVE